MIDEKDQDQRRAALKGTAAKRVALDYEDMRNVMGTRAGRRTVFRILDSTGLTSQSFTGNSETFFREGKRSIGILLHNELQDICPDLYTLMQTENRKKES